MYRLAHRKCPLYRGVLYSDFIRDCIQGCGRLLLSVVRPSLEYGSEIWDCNKSQARALDSWVVKMTAG